jgi:hypothetical protein
MDGSRKFYGINCREQQTRVRSPAKSVGGTLKILQHKKKKKKKNLLKILEWSSDFERLFNTTYATKNGSEIWKM